MGGPAEGSRRRRHDRRRRRSRAHVVSRMWIDRSGRRGMAGMWIGRRYSGHRVPCMRICDWSRLARWRGVARVRVRLGSRHRLARSRRHVVTGMRVRLLHRLWRHGRVSPMGIRHRARGLRRSRRRSSMRRVRIGRPTRRGRVPSMRIGGRPRGLHLVACVRRGAWRRRSRLVPGMGIGTGPAPSHPMGSMRIGGRGDRSYAMACVGIGPAAWRLHRVARMRIGSGLAPGHLMAGVRIGCGRSGSRRRAHFVAGVGICRRTGIVAGSGGTVLRLLPLAGGQRRSGEQKAQ